MMTHPDGTAMFVDPVARIGSDLMPAITGPGGPITAAVVDSTTGPADNFLSTKDLASLIHVDPSTLRRWRNAEPPAGPPFTRLSPGVVVYNLVDVHLWIARGRIDPAERA